ncbi:phosphatase PAP2 family protein [Streptomyces sp. IBSBF 2435]|uniref:phosphatase PAP2 family protein n=1 Tax=Streptomyces sp. IBSBF 2435 TaxID=2903531 RepID=UPI002FDBAA1C
MRRADSAAQRGTSISRPPSTAPGHADRRPVPGAPSPDDRTVPGHADRRLPSAPGSRAGRRPPTAAGHLDRRLLAALRDCGGNPHIAGAVRVLGQAGEHGAVWVAAGAAGALADRERRQAWLRATAVVGAAHLTSMGVKRLVRRPRPCIPGAAPLVRTAGRHSFPSSHAASSAAAVIAFGALLPGRAAVPVLAAAICVSRLVAGVHYPSDVACGALLGAAAARLGRGWALGALPGGGAGFGRFAVPERGVALAMGGGPRG